MRKHMRTAVLLAGIVVPSFCWIAPVIAQDSAPARAYNIPAQPLGSALSTYAEQSGVNVVFDPQVVGGKQGPSIHGGYRPDEALQSLLRGSGLTARRDRNGNIQIERGGPISMRIERRVPSSPESQELPSADGNAAIDVDDIVVTAQRRTERLSDTPIAITALAGEDLASRGISSAGDLNALAPNLRVAVDGTVTYATIRGIGITTSGDTLSPSVTFNVDGIVMGRPRNATMQMYDLERVEVLRGPQGTLYGRNASAGSINLITNKPNFDDVSGSIKAAAGNEGMLEAEAVLNVPLTDTLAIRFAGRAHRRENYSKTRNMPANGFASLEHGLQDGFRSINGRISLLFRPTESFRWLITGDAGGINGYENQNDASNPLTSLAAFEVPNPFAGKKNRSKLTTIAGGYERLRNYGINSEINYDLSFATVTHQFGYRYFDNFSDRFSVYFDAPSAASAKTGQSNAFNAKQITNEIRLSSLPESRIKWVAGAYAFRDIQDNVLFLRPIAPPLGQFTAINRRPDTRTTSYAAFADATIPITPTLGVTAGIRYSKDKLKAIDISPRGAITHPRFSSDNVSYRAGLEFKPDDRNLLYAMASTGYKAGGLNYTAGISFDPETIESYEVGYKGRIFDTLSVSVAAFHANNKDAQVSIVLPSGILVQNATNIKNYGVETEVIWRPTTRDRIELSSSFQHARMGSFPRCVLPANLIGNCSNTQAANAPDATLRGIYSHSIPFKGGSSLSLRAVGYWSSSFNISIGDTPYLRQPNYHTIDLDAQWTSTDKSWAVQFYIKNLEDVVVIQQAALTIVQSGFNLGPPRTFGIRLSHNF